MSTERGCQCGQAHGACAFEFQYAVKIVCGEIEECGPGVPHPPVAPGLYFTAINIHNPSKCRVAQFRWKVVAAAPLDQDPPVAQPVYQRPRVLRPDLALEIDCEQVMALLPPPKPKFVKGYVVIESDIELDVVAVYSGTQGAKWPLNSFHTERVPPRCVPVCEDLVLPLHTGMADWRTVAAPSGPLGPVVPVNQNIGAWAELFGSLWVSQTSADGTGAGAGLGVRVYELSFDLCFGFTVPAQFQIQVAADDSAVVSLNNTPLSPGGGQVGNPSGGTGFQTPTLLAVNPNLLRAGRNSFRVAVKNGDPPNGTLTGFSLAGILHVIKGKCPCALLPIVTRLPGVVFEAESGAPSVENFEPSADG